MRLPSLFMQMWGYPCHTIFFLCKSDNLSDEQILGIVKSTSRRLHEAVGIRDPDLRFTGGSYRTQEGLVLFFGSTSRHKKPRRVIERIYAFVASVLGASGVKVERQKVAWQGYKYVVLVGLREGTETNAPVHRPQDVTAVLSPSITVLQESAWFRSYRTNEAEDYEEPMMILASDDPQSIQEIKYVGRAISQGYLAVYYETLWGGYRTTAPTTTDLIRSVQVGVGASIFSIFQKDPFLKAVWLSRMGHRRHFRRTSLPILPPTKALLEQYPDERIPYSAHPLIASAKAMDLGMDMIIIIATLLHDLVEDESLLYRWIILAFFGREIQEVVRGMSEPPAWRGEGEVSWEQAVAEHMNLIASGELKRQFVAIFGPRLGAMMEFKVLSGISVEKWHTARGLVEQFQHQKDNPRGVKSVWDRSWGAAPGEYWQQVLMSSLTQRYVAARSEMLQEQECGSMEDLLQKDLSLWLLLMRSGVALEILQSDADRIATTYTELYYQGVEEGNNGH